jgi:nicotinamide mononucleotide transporter
MDIFDIQNIFFQLLGYPVSFVEFIATIFGLFSIYLATKANILTWHTGIVNEIFLFILFFQVQLYADMFLQIYFFVVTIYGLYNWNKETHSLNITTLTTKIRFQISGVILLSTVLLGFFFKNIHLFWPQFFKIEASYPFFDSFVMVLSIIATVLLAKKLIETWILWILVDIVCVVLYAKKDINFLSLEYLIFLFLAIYGLYNWKKELNNA